MNKQLSTTSGFNQDFTTLIENYESSIPRGVHQQSEAELEESFIRLLENQGYEHYPATKEYELLKNLRYQLGKLNKHKFTDTEWEKLLNQINSPEMTTLDRTTLIQDSHIISLGLDDGSTKNIYLIDKADIHKNHLQVINQYQTGTGKGSSRYDVTILVNGLPLVHIELKRRGVAIREAFNQIARYKRSSFDGLYSYIQIFVISNGTNTKYYSNTSRGVADSFKFTSFWTDINNKAIPDLLDFAVTFLAKPTILNILTKYCVFTEDKKLLVMRPYQIAATEKIVERVNLMSNNYPADKRYAGGFIWHTTGSGKTLTSFKTATLLKDLTDNYFKSVVDKVIFVVDRQDLDYQTLREFNKFEKDSVDSNSSTKVLKRQLEDKDRNGHHKETKLIVTTIQKLSRFVSQNKAHPIYNKSVVFIFDECHRSQAGKMHSEVGSAFKKYYMFGFTGTPIFKENLGTNSIYTTEDLFGKNLHTYTVVNAINDDKVLPFKVEYASTVTKKKQVQDKKVKRIDTQEVLDHPDRLRGVVEYILENFETKTKGIYSSLFTVGSIPTAVAYYKEFQKQVREKGSAFKVATIFSINPQEDENSEHYGKEGADGSTQNLMGRILSDYNSMFSTNFSTSPASYQSYYQDVAKRLRNREIDLLIVVNMFLTGFDAPKVNTLWVDRNLKHHGLIQAFSRTNRILDATKTHGNIVCFRDLQAELDDALKLFAHTGLGDIARVMLIRGFTDYYEGYTDNGVRVEGYKELVEKLTKGYPVGDKIVGEANKKEFAVLFGKILRLRNILSTFEGFQDTKAILTPRDFEDYKGEYLDLVSELRVSRDQNLESIVDDIEFEVELLRQVEVNIDYIIKIIVQYVAKGCTNKATLKEDIARAVRASLQLRSKSKLIDKFVDTLTPETNVEDDWVSHVEKARNEDIQALIESENLHKEEAIKFIEGCIYRGSVETSGTALTSLMKTAPGYFSGRRSSAKETLASKIEELVEKYRGTLDMYE